MKSLYLLQILLLASSLLVHVNITSAQTNDAIGTDDCEAFSQYPLKLGLDGTKTHMMVRSTETTITFVMRYTGQAWLSVGFSKSGFMVGPRNIAVMGSNRGVSKFLLQGKIPDGIVNMDFAEQTLVNATYTQNVTEGSELTFTRYLEDGENPDDYIAANGKVKLIWAVGIDNETPWHQEFGSIDVTIGPCQIFDASGALLVSIDTTAEQNVLKTHGILATIAIGVLMPVGVLASSARKWLGTCWKKEKIFDAKTWFFIHAALMGTSSILFVTLFILGVVGKNMGSGEIVHFETIHEKMGLVLFLLVLIQVTIAALFRPSPTTSTTPDVVSKVDDDDNETNFGSADVNSFASNSGSGTRTKSVARKIWEAKHTIGGFVIIALGCFELKSGLALYATLYGATGTTKTLEGVLYGWIAVVGTLLLTAAFQIYSRRMSV